MCVDNAQSSPGEPSEGGETIRGNSGEVIANYFSGAGRLGALSDLNMVSGECGRRKKSTQNEI